MKASLLLKSNARKKGKDCSYEQPKPGREREIYCISPEGEIGFTFKERFDGIRGLRFYSRPPPALAGQPPQLLTTSRSLPDSKIKCKRKNNFSCTRLTARI
jgi:hypothetical protein